MKDSKETKKQKAKRLAWFVVRHTIAFALGAASLNLDRILDKLLWVGEWDRWLKMIATAFGQ